MSAAEQVTFALLEGHDFLLDGIHRHHAVDVHGLGLSDAMGPVHGLVLGRGIPPRVEHEDVIGLGQGESESTGLQGDQEHRGVTLAEPGDAGWTVAGAAVKVDVLDPLLLQGLAHQPQESGEGGKDQCAVPLPG